MKKPWIAALIVALILVAFRIFTAHYSSFANISPVAALLFCGGAFWKTNKWMLPTAALTWFLSWPLTSAIQGHPLFTPFMLTTGISFAIVAYIGFKFTNSSNGKLVLGTLLGALAFYLITNSIAFFTGSFYPKTIDGYIQCMWTGSPMTGIPTWHFFRNSLVGNTLGTCLFLVAMNIPVIKQQTGFKLNQHAPA